MQERTRLAPSPTGMVHIGTIRTALWDYFLAKQTGGSFLLRIEDTDQARSVEGGVENVLRTLHRLGLDPDEGYLMVNNSVVQKGDYGPYMQSERLVRYQEVAHQLVKNGHAYYSFRTQEEVEFIRKTRMEQGTPVRDDRAQLMDTPEEVARRMNAGESYVIRLKVPDGVSTFFDLIRGEVRFDHKEVDDQVLLKSDGFPTYHLAVVVDDHDMQVTTVLRGEEWLSSTPKQLILYEMLGWEPTRFAHVPLLLNPDKTKLSKRQGDVSAESYLDRGYLPEALVNFLATLGYNPTGDRELYSLEELITLFNLSKVKKSGAVVNFEKLDWMNKQYLMTLAPETLLERLGDRLPTHPQGILRMIEVERARATTLADLAEACTRYEELPAYEASLLLWKQADARETERVLQACLEELDNLLSTDKLEEIEQRVRTWIADSGAQMGAVLHPLRIALSGRQTSPSPFELLYVLGREEAARRIQTALTRLTGRA